MALLSLFSLFLLASATDWTVLKFSRKTDTCDSNDRVIQNATTKLVWSYSSQIPGDENSIQQHEKRGSKSVRFFGAPEVPLPNDVQSLNVNLNNVNITFTTQMHGATTTYWCSTHKIPSFPAKQHIVRVEPILDPRNKLRVHHLLVFVCPKGTLNQSYNGPCYENAPPEIEQCNGKMVYGAWAVGGDAFSMPEGLGLPLGPDETEMLLEIHYDNPNAIPWFLDSSGIKFIYTPTLRQIEAGMMGVGHITDNFFSIPPQQESYTLDAWCPSDCTSNTTWFPSEGIKIVGGFLHTHVTGRAVQVSHYRNGTELPNILAEPTYDFNYQDLIFLNQERHILPGDTLRVRCTYNTMSRTQPTKMGLSTREEMCVAFLIYYPRFADNEEYCMYGNFSVPYGVCGPTVKPVQIPSIINPHTPPACIPTPPASDDTVAVLSDKEIDLSSFHHNITLDDEGKYKLYWTVDEEKGVMHGAVAVQTKGWFGLGVSPNGGMVGSDVFIAYVKDGEVHFSDRMAQGQFLPPKDAVQDYFNLSAFQMTVDDTGSNDALALLPSLSLFSILFILPLCSFI